MEKILVLLSAYNGERYIEAQMESLFAQENVDVSFLVRDDGSRDRTVELLKKLPNQERLTIVEGKNLGACGSFLDLIRIAPADYDYYAFCDQDDVWLPEKLSRAQEHLRSADPVRPALYFCGQKITDADLNVLYEHKMDPRRNGYSGCVFNQMAGCTAVFNRALLAAMKKHAPEGIFGHDVWAFRLCVALDGQIMVDEGTYLYYRQHGGNVVGLGNSLTAKLKRAKQYIYKYKPSDYARELLRLYADDMPADRRAFFEAVDQANRSRAARKRLLHDYDIRFNNRFLDLLFQVKVRLKQM